MRPLHGASTHQRRHAARCARGAGRRRGIPGTEPDGGGPARAITWLLWFIGSSKLSSFLRQTPTRNAMDVNWSRGQVQSDIIIKQFYGASFRGFWGAVGSTDGDYCPIANRAGNDFTRTGQ